MKIVYILEHIVIQKILAVRLIIEHCHKEDTTHLTAYRHTALSPQKPGQQLTHPVRAGRDANYTKNEIYLLFVPNETGLESVVTVTLVSVFNGRKRVSLLSENTRYTLCNFLHILLECAIISFCHISSIRQRF